MKFFLNLFAQNLLVRLGVSSRYRECRHLSELFPSLAGTSARRAGASARRAGALERHAGALERRAGALERCAGGLERHAGASARCAGGLERHAGASARCAGALARHSKPLVRFVINWSRVGSEVLSWLKSNTFLHTG